MAPARFFPGPRTRLITALSLFSCLCAELILHGMGYSPGQFDNYGDFRPYDTLQTYMLFGNDENGIYRLGSYVTDTMAMSYQAGQPDLPGRVFADELRITEGVDIVLRDFRLLADRIAQIPWAEGTGACNGMSVHGEFAVAACKSLTLKDQDAPMYGSYLRNPFNPWGFRSIDFAFRPKGRARVMLVGDSNVWGMSLEPIYASFSDILLSRGYIVYNLGIPSTDPAQYEAVVRNYVPLLKPDVVIVNLSRSSDLVPFVREVREDLPLEHLTNVGFLDSHPLGEYLGPEEAYACYTEINSIPNQEDNWFNRLCSRSNLTTQLWQLLFKMNAVKHMRLNEYSRLHNMPDTAKARIMSTHFEGIRATCLFHDVPLVNAMIPEQPFSFSKESPIVKSEEEGNILRILYGGEAYHYPEHLTINDFEESGSHLNNSGSVKYADFLENIIKETLKNDRVQEIDRE
jgi:hypothetical protein